MCSRTANWNAALNSDDGYVDQYIPLQHQQVRIGIHREIMAHRKTESCTSEIYARFCCWAVCRYIIHMVYELNLENPFQSQ